MKRFKWLIAAGVALALLVGGVSTAFAAQHGGQPSPSTTVEANIIGGHAASEKYPAMGSLQVVRNGIEDHSCSATLVFHRWAAINAHCVTEPDGSPRPAGSFHLRLDSPDRTTGGVVVGVEAVLPHAEWDWGTGLDRIADAAMLLLDTYVQVQPWEIPTRTAGRNAITRLLGWGVTEPSGEGPLPHQLQELDVKLVRSELCAGEVLGISDGEICVGNVNGTDGTCFGDGGSAALQRVTANRWQLVGSASRVGTVGGFCGVAPAIYTDWTYYRAWIYQVARTGVVPPRAQSARVAASASQVAASAEGWPCRIAVVRCY